MRRPDFEQSTGRDRRYASVCERLRFFRTSAPEPPTAIIHEPGVAQGAKQLTVGDDTYRHDETNYLITPFNLPAWCHVTPALTGQIEWLKLNFAASLRIDELAAEVAMSTSSLHRHFRAITVMSAQQYQKQLRLQEARRWLLAELGDIASIAHRVGYESPSQFSREYSRHFGAPPLRDSTELRRGREVDQTFSA